MCEDPIRMCDASWRPEYDADALLCRLPASNECEAQDLLEVIGSGGALGTGQRLARLGVTMPEIRRAYEEAIEELVREVERRIAAGANSRELADWVVRERASIARRMRLRQGIGPTVLFEVRDHLRYGPGGRTPHNLRARYAGQGYRGTALDQRLIRGATTPNTGVSNSVVRGARYLRNGGRVVVVLSLATTAYVLVTAPREDLERLLYEEVGSFVGGSGGAALGVGLCLVFGIATGGWGLLACGIVGGLTGGAVGQYAGERIYYTTHDDAIREAESEGTIDADLLLPSIEAAPVCQ